MLLFNGKTVDELTEDDLRSFIENEDYMENQYIDYKKVLSCFKDDLTPEEKSKQVEEFNNDICSFANADGGYLVVGVSEKDGIPKEIIGIDIPHGNKDKYKLQITEKLHWIQPKIPSVKVHFVDLENGKYVLFIEIQADGFVPYVYSKGDGYFRFYIRYENGKRVMNYNQVMRMFNVSLTMQKEIRAFRQSRIDFYSSPIDGVLPYCRIYVISEDFVNLAAHKKVYMLYRKNRSLIPHPKRFSEIIPNIDGIRFLSYDERIKDDAYLFNSGISELNVDLSSFYLNSHGSRSATILEGKKLWEDEIVKHVLYSFNVLFGLGFSKRAFICFDLSCFKGVITEQRGSSKSEFDRNMMQSSVIVADDISNDEIRTQALRNLHYEYLMALGIKNEDDYKKIEGEEYYF